MTPNELTRLRVKLTLTQEALAQRVGVDKSTVSRWESGLRKIPPMDVKLLRQRRERGRESLFRVTLTAFALELSRITGANIPQHSSGRHRIYTCRRGGSCTGLGHILPNKDSRPLFCSSNIEKSVLGHGISSAATCMLHT